MPRNVRTLTPTWRARIGEAHRGKVVSADTRAKIGAAQRGKVVSEETRKKMSAGRKGIPNHRKGRPLPIEHCAALAHVPVDLLDDYRLYRRKKFSVADARERLGPPPRHAPIVTGAQP